MVLIRAGTVIAKLDRNSFRPLAGIMVLIDRTEILQGVERRWGFRPLAGIMVLIPPEIRSKRFAHVCAVSVPLRGLWFLSPLGLCWPCI